MKKTKLVYGVMLGALASVTGSANAAITSPAVVDFGHAVGRTETVLTSGAYYGKPNADSGVAGACFGGTCVAQNGMLVGTIKDDSSANAHVHQSGTQADRMLAFHNDSGGMYFRVSDLTSFSLDSVTISAPYATDNPYARSLAADGTSLNANYNPAYDYFEILGFSEAYNPDLDKGDGTNYSTRVAYQTIYNGFDGSLALNSDFRNVKGVWIHYAGVPNTGNATFSFHADIDNIAVSAAQVAAVPVPAAVWMFGTGLLGMLSFGRSKAKLTA